VLAISCLCDHCIDYPLGGLAYVSVLLVILIGGAILAGLVSRTTASGPAGRHPGSITRLDVLFAARDAVIFGVLGLGLGGVAALVQPAMFLPPWVVASGSAWLGSFLVLLAVRVHLRSATDDGRFRRELLLTIVVALAAPLASAAYGSLLCGLHSSAHCEYRETPTTALALAGVVAVTLGSLVGRALAPVRVVEEP
jgi:hypothetical protein